MIYKYLFLLGLFFMGACGFSPMYATLDDEQVTHKTAEINIAPIANYRGFILQTQLRDQLNPEQLSAPPNFDLYVTLEKPLISDQNIREDFFSSRERVVQKVFYKLVDRQTKTVLLDSNTSATGSYNVTLEPYATYMAKERVQDDLLKIISQTISMHVISFMRKYEVKSEG